MVSSSDSLHELATRLTRLDVGQFVVDDDAVHLHGTDYFVELRAVSAGRGRPYEVRRALGAITKGADYVVVAKEFTPGALEILAEENANYMDVRRLHVRLSTPEFLVHVVDDEEVSPAESPPGQVSLGGAAGAVALEILERRDEDLRVTELARASGVAPATAQRVIFALEEEGLLRPEGKGPQKVRRLLDAPRMLDRYAADAAGDRRLPLPCRVLGDDSLVVARRACSGLRKNSVKCRVTGAVAAALEAPALTETPIAELWVHGPRFPEYLLDAVDGIQSDRGANLILWRATTRGPMAGSPNRRKEVGLLLASPYRIYADLLANPQRGREQAEVYREQVIRF
jgi:hypothetical protein